VRRLVGHCLLVASAAWAVTTQWSYRVAGSAMFGVLPWIGTVLSVLSLFLLIGGLIIRLPAEDRVRRLFQGLERALIVLVSTFILYGAALAWNARLAATPAVMHQVRVIGLVGGDTDSWAGALHTWVDLRSWRNPGKRERVILYPREREALWVGQPVLVYVRQGGLGLPWVTHIHPDEEERLQAVLQFMPSATWPRKQLIRTYFRRGEYARAITMAREYLATHPMDRHFAAEFAGDLFNASQWPAAVPLLEPFLLGKPEATIYGPLGFAMTRAGRHAEGVALLKKAIALDPDEWWPYYALGYAHFYAGEFPEAAPYFEKVLQFRPNYPEIEERLRTIRARMGDRSR
jgi:tetratricopeptide (TPR) repeat protein